jgi:glycosyltransferase involved in cell wall biosynthesis
MKRNQTMIITYEILSGGSELNALKITKYIQNNYFWISLGSKRSLKEFKNKNIKKFYFLNFNILKLLSSIKKINKIIKKKKISTIYAIGLYPGLIASVVKIFCRVKIITTKRNEMNFFNRIKYFPVLLFMNYMSDIIETNSLSIFNKFKHNKFLKKKVIFTNNIIEKEIYTGHKTFLLDKKRSKNIKIIGMALNIRPVKDPLLIKKIIDIILNEKLFKFFIVGRDKDNFWKKIVRKHNNKIYWKNSLPTKQMKNFYNTIDMLLITSKSEGSPNIIPEAFANKVPVATVPISAIKGIVINKFNGSISKNRNPHELVKSIIYIKNNLEKLKRNSKLFFEEKFIFKKTIKKISKYI